MYGEIFSLYNNITQRYSLYRRESDNPQPVGITATMLKENMDLPDLHDELQIHLNNAKTLGHVIDRYSIQVDGGYHFVSIEHGDVMIVGDFSYRPYPTAISVNAQGVIEFNPDGTTSYKTNDGALPILLDP